MKKLAIIILTLLFLVNFVIACENSNNSSQTNSQLELYQWIAFISSYVLVIPIVILYFLRKKTGLWIIIAALVSLVFFIPSMMVVLAAYWGKCQADLYPQYIITAEFLFMLFLFSFQLFSWISQRKTFRKLQ